MNAIFFFLFGSSIKKMHVNSRSLVLLASSNPPGTWSGWAGLGWAGTGQVGSDRHDWALGQVGPRLV